MAKVLICFYSRSGNTKKMAQFVEEGVKAENIECTAKDVTTVSPEELLHYDALVFGSPTYYGSMAYEVKKLLDESVAYHGKLEGRIGGAFSSAANIGGGNETTILDILNAFLIHGMVVQGAARGDHYGPVSVGDPDTRVERQCKALGKRVALLAKRLYA